MAAVFLDYGGSILAAAVKRNGFPSARFDKHLNRPQYRLCAAGNGTTTPSTPLRRSNNA